MLIILYIITELKTIAIIYKKFNIRLVNISKQNKAFLIKLNMFNLNKIKQ
nr:MAG TPA: hypothetical protein [Bacteriophage sp.]